MFSLCILTFMQVQRERGRVKMTRRKESRVRAREQRPGPSGSAAIRKKYMRTREQRSRPSGSAAIRDLWGKSQGAEPWTLRISCNQEKK
jgi:hypothetical protein